MLFCVCLVFSSYLSFPSLVIQVAIDGNKEIILPKNKARVFASTWPKDNGHFLYQWMELFGPSVGVLNGVNKPTLSMNKVNHQLTIQYN